MLRMHIYRYFHGTLKNRCKDTASFRFGYTLSYQIMVQSYFTANWWTNTCGWRRTTISQGLCEEKKGAS